MHTWIVPTGEDRIKASLLSGPAFAHPTAFMRRESIQKFHIRYSSDALHVEDYDFWIRSMFAGLRFGNLIDVYLHYRLNTSGVSQTNEHIQWVMHKQLQQHQIERFIDRTMTAKEINLLRSKKNACSEDWSIEVCKKLTNDFLNANKKKLYYKTSFLKKELFHNFFEKVDIKRIPIPRVRLLLSLSFLYPKFIAKAVFKKFV